MRGYARTNSPAINASVSGCEHNMVKRPRRGVHRSDLPLRLRVVLCGNGRFQYLILRNDGTVAKMSPASFDTENKAHSAGVPVLQSRSMAAKLTP